VTVVDHKRKRTANLQRLDNIRAHPSVTLLVDEYDDDWSRLWWVRIRGDAEVIDEPSPQLVEPLIRKYQQYQTVVPTGAAVVIRVTGVRQWTARGDYGRE
jgi:PPOX class probable F420-dependent enzyme